MQYRLAASRFASVKISRTLTMRAFLPTSFQQQLRDGHVVGHDGDVKWRQTLAVGSVQVQLLSWELVEQDLHSVQVLLLHRLKDAFTDLRRLKQEIRLIKMSQNQDVVLVPAGETSARSHTSKSLGWMRGELQFWSFQKTDKNILTILIEWKKKCLWHRPVKTTHLWDLANQENIKETQKFQIYKDQSFLCFFNVVPTYINNASFVDLRKREKS